MMSFVMNTLCHVIVSDGPFECAEQLPVELPGIIEAFLLSTASHSPVIKLENLLLAPHSTSRCIACLVDTYTTSKVLKVSNICSTVNSCFNLTLIFIFDDHTQLSEVCDVSWSRTQYNLAYLFYTKNAMTPAYLTGDNGGHGQVQYSIKARITDEDERSPQLTWPSTFINQWNLLPPHMIIACFKTEIHFSLLYTWYLSNNFIKIYVLLLYEHVLLKYLFDIWFLITLYWYLSDN